MKIYTEVVIDIKTGQVESEKSFEYQGPLALCGSDGGGDTIDKEYNDRMATIAEAQQEMSEMDYNIYLYGTPTPGQRTTTTTTVGGGSQEYSGPTDIFGNPIGNGGGRYETQQVWNQHLGMYEPQQVWVEGTGQPEQTVTTTEMAPGMEAGGYGTQLGLEQQQTLWDTDTVNALLGYETGQGESLNELQAENLGLQLQGEGANYGSLLDEDIWGTGENFYSRQAGLTESEMQLQGGYLNAANQEDLGGKTAMAQSEYLDMSYGMDPEQWADQAQTDVAAGYAGSMGAMTRDASRLGLNPNSGAFVDAQKDMNLERTKDIAAGRTQGRQAGEEEKFRRLGLSTQTEFSY